MTTRFTISSDSTRLAFDMTGAGAAIILLHGGGSSRVDWHAAGYVARLRDKFRVITMDLRGHGESDKPADPAMYATGKMGDDILAVADACNAEKFLLCGFSFGGNVSRYLAARSDRVSKLVMIGNRLGTGVSGEFRRFAFDFRERWKPVVDNAGDRFDPKLLPQKDQAGIRGLSFPGELIPSVLAWSTAMLDWGMVTPKDLLCPSLWIIGTENQNAMEGFKEYEREILRSKVQVHFLEGMTHAQEFEHLEQVLPVILDFLWRN